MSTKELIDSLTDEELLLFERELEFQAKERSLLLYNAMRYASEELNKGALYKLVFERTYTKDQDYLIRNEIRKLNNLIYDFLVKIQVQKELVDNKNEYQLWLLRALSTRKLDKAFIRQSKIAIKRLSATNANEYGSKYYELLYTHQSNIETHDQLGIPIYMQHLENWLVCEINYFLERIRKVQISYWGSARNIAFGQGFKHIDIIQSDNPVFYEPTIPAFDETPYIRHLKHFNEGVKARYYSIANLKDAPEEFNDVVIIHFIKAFKAIEHETDRDLKKQKDRCRSVIGTLLFESEAYEEGYKWMEPFISNDSFYGYRATAFH